MTATAVKDLHLGNRPAEDRRRPGADPRGNRPVHRQRPGLQRLFPAGSPAEDVRDPLTLTEMGGRIDVFVNVKGSGKLSQSGAVMLGLARASRNFAPTSRPLRETGFLTRDARMVERKKFGHKKARKSFQFSKR